MKESKHLTKILGGLQFFIGSSGIAGGMGLVTDPSGMNMEMSIEMLKHSPFTNFLIPGIVLFIVIGLGNMLGGALSFIRFRKAAETTMALGTFLIAWIIIPEKK